MVPIWPVCIEPWAWTPQHKLWWLQPGRQRRTECQNHNTHLERPTEAEEGGEKAESGFSYNFQIFTLWFSPIRCYLIQFKIIQEMWDINIFLCNELVLLNIVKLPQSTNMHFRMNGDSKFLLALCMSVTSDTLKTWYLPSPWSRPHLLKWLVGRCWSSESLGEEFAAATDSSGTTHKYTPFQWFP